MFAFVLIYLTTFISIISSLSNNKLVKISVALIVTVVFTLILGLRSEFIGVDTPTYYIIFNIINYSGIDSSNFRWEPGFVALNQLIHFLNGDAKYAILAFAFLTIYFIINFLNKTSPNFTISLTLYIGFGYFFYAFNGIRQAIAMSIICYSFRYLYEKKYILWTLLFLLAFSFHYSSAVFLLYFTPLAVKRHKLLLWGWLISLAFIASGSLIAQLVDSVSFLFPSQYVSYAEFDQTESFRIKMLVSQFFFIGFYLCYKKIEPSFEKRLLLLSMYGVILSNIFAFAGYLDRTAFYFVMFQLVAVPITINFFFKGNSRYLVNTLMFMVVSGFYFRSVLLNSHEQYPYTTWLYLF